MNEIWKDIKGYEGLYQISNLGQVKSLARPINNFNQCCNKDKLLKGGIKRGYRQVILLKDKKRKYASVHRLVAEAFLPNPDKKPQVNHIDGNKKNNRLDNLEWVTASENMKHSYDSKIRVPHQERPVRIVETGEIFKSVKECAEKIEGHDCDISRCLRQSTAKGLMQANGYTHKGLHFEYVNEQQPSKNTDFLYDFQMEAVKKARNGSILNGSVGSGKSRTGLFYYFKENGGWIEGSDYTPMKNPKDLYIITTAKKRDSLEWNAELAWYRLSTDPESNYYKNKVVVDSWNNIKKYAEIKGAFFLLDEDRVTGSGAWVKAFLKIAKNNDWIILSATPGDTYMDYWAVFVANGFYKNKTEFQREHVVYSRFAKFPQIERYIGTQRLDRLRNRILIDMTVQRHTKPHHEDVYCNYNVQFYKDIFKKRWNPYKDEPIQQASSLCYVLRRIVNEDESRQVTLLELLEDHPKAIIFYNFDYEREILLNLGYAEGTKIAEWSGHAHQPVPTGSKWVYLTQYTSGCEGWNCITTDTIIFYSQNYSYKVMTQAAGRIDRLNTKFIDLYYFHLKSRSGIDLAISRALKEKKLFNETRWVNKWIT